MAKHGSIQRYLEDNLYHTQTTSYAPRTKPLEIIAVGLSRSGTESLQRALNELGYQTYHGFDLLTNPGHTEYWVKLARKKYRNSTGEPGLTAKDFDVVLGRSHAILDTTAAAFAVELIAAYPDAKVVLNTRRDMDAWYKSVLTSFGGLPHGTWMFETMALFSAELYWQARVIPELLWRFFHDDFEATGKWRYREHTLVTRALVPEEKLLEWTVEDGWGPLCRFLNKQVPRDKAFPKGNIPGEMIGRVNKANAAMTRTAFRNMGICAALLLALGVTMIATYMMSIQKAR